jgi:hypothetical protein
MKSTTEQILEAQQRIQELASKIQRLETQAELEESFSLSHTAWVVTRRSIDTGRFEGILAVFLDCEEANRYAASLPGYGVGKDIFVDGYPLSVDNGPVV